MTLAVIAILAAILVPIVGSARKAANSAAGAAKLRGIGQAVLTYASDHDGYLPGPTFAGQRVTRKPDGRFFLVDRLAPYLGAENLSQGRVVEAFANEALLDRLGDDPKYLHYYAVHRLKNHDGDWTNRDPWGYPGYGGGLDAPMPIAAIDRPSEQAALKLLDAKIEGPPGYPDGSSYADNALSEPIDGDFRHVLFFDGHVGQEKVDLGDAQ